MGINKTSRRSVRIIAASALLVSLAVDAYAAATVLTPCRLRSAELSASSAAQCATLAVPEDPNAPQGAQLQLSVAVIPALRSKPQPEPLFIISGGPGQAARDFYLTMSPAFARIRRDRDLVIVDQRGTGHSQRLDCNIEGSSALLESTPAVASELAKACLASMPAGAHLYTTSVAVRDLDAVREALGYTQINLYGISYGTRVAQHYARRYPQHVRALVLDGVVPPALALGPRIALDAQAALDAIFDRCAQSAECQAAFPALREEFTALTARLTTTPMQLSFDDPVTAEPVRMKFGRAELAAAIRMLNYSDETASILPLLIHETATGKRTHALAAQFQMIARALHTQFAYGMQFSVVCSEDAPRWSMEQVSREALQATYIGEQLIDSMRAVCEVWPRGPVDADFHDPLHSSVPTLLLSGANDPVTPAAYAQRVAATLTNAKHLMLIGQGHGQLAIGCMPQVLAKFVASASFQDVGEECLQTVGPAAFFTSHAGPTP